MKGLRVQGAAGDVSRGVGSLNTRYSTYVKLCVNLFWTNRWLWGMRNLIIISDLQHKHFSARTAGFAENTKKYFKYVHSSFAISSFVWLRVCFAMYVCVKNIFNNHYQNVLIHEHFDDLSGELIVWNPFNKAFKQMVNGVSQACILLWFVREVIKNGYLTIRLTIRRERADMIIVKSFTRQIFQNW